MTVVQMSPRGGPLDPLADARDPFDAAAEKVVLGGAMTEPRGLVDACAVGLEARHFHRPAYAELWGHLVAMFARGDPTDVVAVQGRLADAGWPAGLEPMHLLEMLEAVPTVANVGWFARRLVTLAGRRALSDALVSADAELRAPDADARAVAARLAAKVASADLDRAGAPDPAVDAQTAADAVALQRERATAKARALVAEETANAGFTAPDLGPTLLTDILATPPKAKRWTVEGLHRAGFNRVLTAQFKSGKTTTVLNEVRSLVDGFPLFERFHVEPLEGSVAVFNYEVDGDTVREWFADLGIRNTDRVHVFNLRGVRMPLTSDRGMDTVVRWLSDVGCAFWVVDPYTRARSSCGLSENSNDDVARFTDALDEIKLRAGVRDLLVAAHTGRGEQAVGEERARGATRLDDWADVRQLMVRGKAEDDDRDSRYVWAEGRDVSVEEFKLDFDPETRRLVATDASRAGRNNGSLLQDVVYAVEANPGITANNVASLLSHGRNKVLHALKEAVRMSRVIAVDGPNRSHMHYVPGAVPADHQPGGTGGTG